MLGPRDVIRWTKWPSDGSLGHGPARLSRCLLHGSAEDTHRL